tara:strand:- start:1855 stop:2514 length:660 start_codon:yes stop_codon:yes gene_type:complete
MEAKIAGGTADQRAEAQAQAQAEAERIQAMGQEAQEAAQAAQVKKAADEAAMAAVERAEAERTKREAEAREQANKQKAAQADPSAEARRLLEEAEGLRAKAEEERARLEQLGNDYAERLKRERDRDRVASLRRMGAIAGVSDVQLLMISPDVDPETPGGRAALDKWREENAGLFHQAQSPSPPSVDQMLGSLKAKRSPFGHYGPEYFAQIMAKNLGRIK